MQCISINAFGTLYTQLFMLCTYRHSSPNNTSIFVLQGCCTSSVPVACLVPYEAAPISAFVSTVVKQSAGSCTLRLSKRQASLRVKSLGWN